MPLVDPMGEALAEALNKIKELEAALALSAASRTRLATQIANLNRNAAANLGPLLNRKERQAWMLGYAAAELDALSPNLPKTINPHPEDA